MKNHFQKEQQSYVTERFNLCIVALWRHMALKILGYFLQTYCY